MAKQITTEQESNLQRQARRRLIGAVALVLAIVVILPMVFDSTPSPSAANNIELRIPDKDKAPAFHLEEAAVPVVASAPVAAVSAVVVTQVEVAASAVAAPVVVQPVKVAQAESKPKPEAKPKAETKANAVPQTGWVVQVGAYSNADTAKQMHAKLNKLGYHAYTEKVGSNVRVRVGNYPTREAAEKIKHKLEAIGLHPNVVNLE